MPNSESGAFPGCGPLAHARAGGIENYFSSDKGRDALRGRRRGRSPAVLHYLNYERDLGRRGPQGSVAIGLETTEPCDPSA